MQRIFLRQSCILRRSQPRGLECKSSTVDQRD